MAIKSVKLNFKLETPGSLPEALGSSNEFVTKYHSPTLKGFLKTAPPERLYHYTAVANLISIAKSKELWATHIQHCNDATEVVHVVNTARKEIRQQLRERPWAGDEGELLAAMAQAPNAAKRFYLISLSEDGDMLSQWRAYTPPNAGASIGFFSAQLDAVCMKQGFALHKCLYGDGLQVTRETIQAFLERFRSAKQLGGDPAKARDRLVWEFSQHCVRLGCIIKHGAFSEEKEWRLVSRSIDDDHPSLDCRAGRLGFTPFFRLKLVDQEHNTLARDDGLGPSIIAGPTVDWDTVSFAMQVCVPKILPEASYRVSHAPYRVL